MDNTLPLRIDEALRYYRPSSVIERIDAAIDISEDTLQEGKKTKWLMSLLAAGIGAAALTALMAHAQDAPRAIPVHRAELVQHAQPVSGDRAVIHWMMLEYGWTQNRANHEFAIRPGEWRGSYQRAQEVQRGIADREKQQRLINSPDYGVASDQEQQRQEKLRYDQEAKAERNRQTEREEADRQEIAQDIEQREEDAKRYQIHQQEQAATLRRMTISAQGYGRVPTNDQALAAIHQFITDRYGMPVSDQTWVRLKGDVSIAAEAPRINGRPGWFVTLAPITARGEPGYAYGYGNTITRYFDPR